MNALVMLLAKSKLRSVSSHKKFPNDTEFFKQDLNFSIEISNFACSCMKINISCHVFEEWVGYVVLYGHFYTAKVLLPSRNDKVQGIGISVQPYTQIED